MAFDDVRVLLVRPADLALARARLSGFEVSGSDLVAGPGARIELTLPPQAVGEGLWVAGAPSPARTGGPSRVTFTVPETAVVPLTADGVLAAVATGTALPGRDSLLVEMPWHLWLAPRPAADGDALRSEAPTAVRRGAGGSAGVWHLRLEAASGLALDPVTTAPDLPGLTPALDENSRNQVLAAGSALTPPTAPYVDLSPLGGTMAAEGSWPQLTWEHHVVLGRDMAVRTESRGVLYPTGHPAVLVRTTTRQLLPVGSGPADAGLQQVAWLIVTDPVRGRSADAAVDRQLPFDTVEVLERVLPVGPSQRVAVSRGMVPKRIDQLRAELDQMRADLAAAEASLPQLVEEVRAQVRSDGEARRGGLDADLATVRESIGSYQSAKAESDAWDSNPAHAGRWEEDADGIQVWVEGEPNPDPWSSEDQAALDGLLAQESTLAGQLGAIDADTQAALTALETEDGQAASGGVLGEAISTARRLRAEAPAREELVRQIDAETRDHDVAVWPTAPDGTPLHVPVRCDGVRLSLPAMFLHDEDLPESDDWPAFAPLREADVQRQVARAWEQEEARHVSVAGATVDLVRADRRGEPAAPNDVLPVQRLSLAGAHDGDGFRAVLDGARVVLAAAQQLVPGVTEAVDVAYREAYRLQGEAEHAVLDLVEELPIDFREAADQAGALVSPQFAADVVSRLHGPAPAAAIAGLLTQPPDPATVFGATTLLGIPLGSLLAPVTEALPQPLTITATPDGGASMSWTDLTLTDHGPFRATAGRTRLELRVDRTPQRTTTSCRLDDFALVLPPGRVELVRLDFGSLAFTQDLGAAPDLDVTGLRVHIGGDLGLLEALQDAVDLGDVAPRVHTSPHGMAVDYTLAVPEVTAGMFALKDVAVRAAVDVPFDGRPIVTTLAFASRDKPFRLGVSVFAGGGYLLFEIDDQGIRTLEASLDFGAAVAINIGVAKAEVHALGGVRFALEGDVVRCTGFLRIGGSVDLLGLVSVSVELRVELTFVSAVPAVGGSPAQPARLTGRATAVIEIDVTFWSGSVELDSGDYTFVGGSDPAAVPASSSIAAPPPTLPDWQRYRDAFQRA